MIPVSPIGADWADIRSSQPVMPAQPANVSFVQQLVQGVEATSNASAEAGRLLAAYAAGEPVSPHELMIAMEQARTSLQLAVEVRNRLVEAYQEVSRMQV